MNNLQEFYRKIEYLRSNGVKMKEIADWIDMAPSILSSLYTTVLPNYFEGIKSYPPEEALDSALALVNNVSKKRLLSHIEEMILRLDQMELAEPNSLKDNPFAKQLMEETRLSASKIEAFKGIYTSYSLSSSSDCLKMEPFLLSPADQPLWRGSMGIRDHARSSEFPLHAEREPSAPIHDGNDIPANTIFQESPPITRIIHRAGL